MTDLRKLLSEALPKLKKLSVISKYTKDGAQKKYDHTPAGLDELIESISAALIAEKEEPVAWLCQGKFVEIGKHATCPLCQPLYAAPQSDDRAGMLRAAEICKEWEGKLSQGAGYAIRTAREAITSAADQVKAEGCTRSHPHENMSADCEQKTVEARDTNSRSNAMQAVKEDAPVMKAWNNYKSCDEFKNTRKWALHEEHVDGSLWAAFYAGFFACAVDQVNTDDPQQPTSDDVMAALLFCLWHHQGGNSKIGQPIRLALGIGQDEPLTDEQLAIAERVQSALCASASNSAMKVQACRKEDRDMLSTDAGKELLTKAAAAIAAQQEPDTVAVPIHQLEHWAEYWNGSANEKAMSDALEHILGEVDDLLRAAQEAK